MVSPAEFMLEITNIDFVDGDNTNRLESLVRGWRASLEQKLLNDNISIGERRYTISNSGSLPVYRRSLAMQSVILVHRMALVYVFMVCTDEEIISRSSCLWC